MTLALRSELLLGHGFAHGFSLRTGGVSAPPFASLNLGRQVGDDPDAVAQNHERFAREVGFSLASFYEATQVHGAHVVRVDASVSPALVQGREADALVSASAGCAVGVRAADCVPLLLADAESGAVAAVHAGWRGIVGEVVPAAVNALHELGGSRLQRMVAAVFPAIGVDAFEIGDEVAERFVAAELELALKRRASERPHADLVRAVHAQLLRAGLVAAQVEIVAGCTFSDSSLFFSHRRDRGRTGRHLAAIVPRC